MSKIGFNPNSIAGTPPGGSSSEIGTEAKDGAKRGDFGRLLLNSLSEINKSQTSADKQVANFLSGNGGGLHETLLALEKADISMRLLVQVRNKAVEAYREIMRMQV